jgi:hypothetical protein
MSAAFARGSLRETTAAQIAAPIEIQYSTLLFSDHRIRNAFLHLRARTARFEILSRARNIAHFY